MYKKLDEYSPEHQEQIKKQSELINFLVNMRLDLRKQLEALNKEIEEADAEYSKLLDLE